MGGAVAEALGARGLAVTLVTPAALVSEWTHATLEQPLIQSRLLEAGIEIVASHKLARVAAGEVELACVFTGRTQRRPASAVVMVTSRVPDDSLYHELMADAAALEQAGIRSVTRIGDCLVPGLIAAAVQDGHCYAQDLDAPPPPDVPFRVERISLESSPSGES
jgi:dimethylamine/trimethylamine dehydrogenase